MPYVKFPNGNLHYELDGNSALPVLVLSNSLGTNVSLWQAQVPEFSRRFRVLRYDSRGHGESSFTDDEYSVEILARDVLTLLDHLEIALAHFCGISVGGLVGQWLGLHASQRIGKLVLSNTAAKIGSMESWDARIQAVKANGIASMSQSILDRWFTAPFHQREPNTVERFRKILEATSADAYAGTCIAIRDADFRDEIVAVTAETLVIAGTQDAATPPEGGRWLAERIAHCRYVELDAAHLSNVELPRKFNQEILAFLDS